MKTKFIAIAHLLFAVCHSTHAQGALTPPGAPAPTMKSLDQIEARTPISSVPFTITTGGSYYLTGNLSDSLIIVGFNVRTHQPIYAPSLASTNAITITASGVALDLNGFTINCSLGSSGAGILLDGDFQNINDIRIVNGFIQGGVSDNNGLGEFAGKGFSSGIHFSGNQPANVFVARVSVAGCWGYGISLTTNYQFNGNFNNGQSTVVESCTVRTVSGNGINASTVKQSSAVDCGNYGIYGDQVCDCRGQSSGYGNGIVALTADNCYGYGDSHGIYALSAENCYGYSSHNEGIYALTAQNCYGYGDIGIDANTALNCYGYGSSGDGIDATTALNCYGQSSAGIGLFAGASATGCYGYSLSGTGLSAFIANVCQGESSTGTSLDLTHNVNSYSY